MHWIKSVNNIKAAIAAGHHLFPSRTEKLSPLAPMVLHTRGRVGSRHPLREAPMTESHRGFVVVGGLSPRPPLYGGSLASRERLRAVRTFGQQSSRISRACKAHLREEKNECVIMDVPCRGTLTCINERKGENEGMCPKSETADAPSSQTHSTPSLQGRAGGGSALSRARTRALVFFFKKSITSLTKMPAAPCPSGLQAVIESERW